MKTYIVILVCAFLSLEINAQSLVGAWEAISTSEHGQPIKTVIIFSESYQVFSTHNAETGEFIHTTGGNWKTEDDLIIENVEFDSDAPDAVGKTVSFKFTITDNTLKLEGFNSVFTRLDDGTLGKLQGAWLMSGRVRDGKIQSRPTDVPRKTMKILSGTRFQWIAYNTETKEFKGTGGGTYTTINNEYTENITFFSKDNSRVGQSLKFNFELIDGNWHHTGLSSKGDPIHEIWSQRTK
ncbi:membrane or secreted protein [Formosa algae]|uniref:membrane or secreted protein n=1 Tax=Formosa algae TaxID=225843 RepID=UPI000CCDC629|nr:membrane or secreted protein [Formosa algae]PNW28399.1 membrane or secreted protein [Formosa algae]